MNVELIYRLHRDEAFAKQFTAEQYTTFVAMPFGNTERYNADEVYRLLRERVHVRANQLAGEARLPRSFAPLQRVSENNGTATIVTDSIATRILEDHFFVGDLTGSNPGAVLETGAALALKPNYRMVLLTQGAHADLHFDVKVTFVNGYTTATLVDHVARGLVSAAKEFESETKLFVTEVSASLTSDAILLLNRYGVLWAQRDPGTAPSLFEDPGSCGERFRGADGQMRFQQAVRELLQKRLLWTDYLQGSDPPRRLRSRAQESRLIWL